MPRTLQDRLFALGLRRTSENCCITSALPPKADIAEHHRHVRFVPIADIRLGQKRVHEVVFTRKLKPYFSKTDFAVCVHKNDKYRTAPDLAFAVNATG